VTRAAGGATFVWGLKRSGIHLLESWLYANLGATRRDDLDADGLHPLLQDGYRDAEAGVAFHNNCGGWSSRTFDLADLTGADFASAASRQTSTLFGIEDCRLEHATKVAGLDGALHVIVLRDPLNNLASRLAGAEKRPEVFRVDEAYLDLLEAYAAEYLGRTEHLTPKVLVSFDRFLTDVGYRDSVATDLGVDNRDRTDEVSSYGGGSSFGDAAADPEALLTRFQQHPLPSELLASLATRAAVTDLCSSVFGYDLRDRVAER
jgi:hypothetical protein